MISRISELLDKSSGLKAKEIANRLQCERKEVNAILHGNKSTFRKDNEHQWFLSSAREQVLSFPPNWIAADDFEDALLTIDSPLDSGDIPLRVVIPDGCNLLLEASVRLLALCNQLADAGVPVEIDLRNNNKTRSYLSRVGFLDFLSSKVAVLPERPATSGATTYKGNNRGLYEFESIDPLAPNSQIPKRLMECFVANSDERYAQNAFTFIAELFGNVRGHSKTRIPGFAGLQRYRGRSRQLQTVISDNGIGIIGSLGPVLAVNHPDLAEKFDLSEMDDQARLIVHVFTKGQVSSINEKGRGLGLKTTKDVAESLKADLSIRQERFSVTLSFRNGVLRKKTRKNLPLIRGTHICFNFLVD